MKTARALCLLIPILALALTFGGCEVESASENNVEVVPSSATMRIGESREFRASGGFEYTWSLEDDTMGHLSTTEGPTTVYTADTDPGAEARTARQILRVISTLREAANSTTNAVGEASSYVHTAEAFITHESIGTILAVSPASVELKQWDTQTFTASGANRYTWTLRDYSLGELSDTEGPETTYISLVAPIDDNVLQVLTVTSERGEAASAQIVHSQAELTLTPPSGTLIDVGDTLTFVADGGDQYTWSLSSEANAMIIQASGNTATIRYDSAPPSTQSIVLSVRSGNATAQVFITLFVPTTTL